MKQFKKQTIIHYEQANNLINQAYGLLQEANDQLERIDRYEIIDDLSSTIEALEDLTIRTEDAVEMIEEFDYDNADYDMHDCIRLIERVLTNAGLTKVQENEGDLGQELLSNNIGYSMQECGHRMTVLDNADEYGEMGGNRDETDHEEIILSRDGQPVIIIGLDHCK